MKRLGRRRAVALCKNEQRKTAGVVHDPAHPKSLRSAIVAAMALMRNTDDAGFNYLAGGSLEAPGKSRSVRGDMLDNHSTARSIWLRVLQFPLTRLVVLGGAVFLLMGINNGFMKKFKDTPALTIAITLVMASIALAVYAGFARFIEQREADELSLPGMGREWATGALIGAALYTFCVLILMLLGMYRIEGLNPWTYVLPAVAMAVSSGIFEELLFRGVLFRSIEDLFGSWISLAVSALVFGFVHLFNPGGTLEGAVYISVEAGVLLAAAYMLTRRLWLSIGFHMAWNYTQSAIFSGVVSGGVHDPGLIRSNIRGPEVLTGGSFGMESSLIAFTVCTATGVVLLAMAIRRGAILRTPWNSKAE